MRRGVAGRAGRGAGGADGGGAVQGRSHALCAYLPLVFVATALLSTLVWQRRAAAPAAPSSSVDAAAGNGGDAPATRPRIFVYPGNESLALLRSSSYSARQQLVSAPYVHRRLTDERALAAVTDDPEEADLFFVPFYSSVVAVRAGELTARKQALLWQRELDAVREHPRLGRYWRRRNGTDHVWVLGMDWGGCLVWQHVLAPEMSVPVEVRRGVVFSTLGTANESDANCFQREWDLVLPPPLNQRELDRAVALAAWALGRASVLAEVPRSVALRELDLPGDALGTLAPFGQDGAEPPPEAAEPPPPAEAPRQPSRNGEAKIMLKPLAPSLYAALPFDEYAAWVEARPRPQLVHYRGQPHSIRDVRARLEAVLTDDERLWYGGKPPHEARRRGLIKHGKERRVRWGDFQDVTLRSEFCLCPAGFAPWSVRLVALLMTGCVPVVVSDGLLLPFGGGDGDDGGAGRGAVDWQRAVVRLPERDIPRLYERLAEVDEERRRDMRRYGVREAFRLLALLPFRLPGEWGRRDAFDEFLRLAAAQLQRRRALGERFPGELAAETPRSPEPKGKPTIGDLARDVRERQEGRQRREEAAKRKARGE